MAYVCTGGVIDQNGIPSCLLIGTWYWTVFTKLSSIKPLHFGACTYVVKRRHSTKGECTVHWKSMVYYHIFCFFYLDWLVRWYVLLLEALDCFLWTSCISAGREFIGALLGDGKERSWNCFGSWGCYERLLDYAFWQVCHPRSLMCSTECSDVISFIATNVSAPDSKRTGHMLRKALDKANSKRLLHKSSP